MRLALALAWAAIAAAPLLLAARASGSPRLRRPPDTGRVEVRPVGLRRLLRPQRSPGGRRGGARDLRWLADVAATADLLAVAAGAGLTPLLALRAVAPVAPASTGFHLHGILAAVTDGARLVDALDERGLAEPPLAAVLELLAASERSGAPVGLLLARTGRDERLRLRQRSLAHARKLPVRLLFPLVFLLLPAFLILTVVPALIAGMR